MITISSSGRSLTQKGVRLVSKGSESHRRPHSLDHLFKGDGREASVVRELPVPNILHTLKRAWRISCRNDGLRASGQDIDTNAH
jgi:hypothetical protein